MKKTKNIIYKYNFLNLIKIYLIFLISQLKKISNNLIYNQVSNLLFLISINLKTMRIKKDI